MSNYSKKILKIVIISVFFAFIVGYTFFRSKNIIFGVNIKGVNIEEKEDGILEIAGVAKNAVELSLQGRLISIDREGNFSETISLLSGYNIVEIKAKDKFGNEDRDTYKLMYIEEYAQKENSDKKSN